jgi:hypothetical protein
MVSAVARRQVACLAIATWVVAREEVITLTRALGGIEKPVVPVLLKILLDDFFQCHDALLSRFRRYCAIAMR